MPGWNGYRTSDRWIKTKRSSCFYRKRQNRGSEWESEHNRHTFFNILIVRITIFFLYKIYQMDILVGENIPRYWLIRIRSLSIDRSLPQIPLQASRPKAALSMKRLYETVSLQQTQLKWYNNNAFVLFASSLTFSFLLI